MSITERIDAITLIPETHRRPDPPAPKSVKIELTGRCNFRCGFCALRMRESQPIDDMDFQLFKKIARSCRDAGVQEAGLFYLGESFSAPHLLCDAISYCKRELEFPYVFLTSNASLAAPTWVAEAMRRGLDSLKWSCNYADVTQFERLAGVKAKYYWRALENIEAAYKIRQSYKYATRIYASSILYDDEQQEKMQPLLRERVLPFVDTHYWLPLYSMGSVATQREAELGYKPTAGNQGRLENLREPLPCWSAFTEAHVTADGILTACCFDADNRFAMADLRETSFADAWSGEKFKALRAAHLARDVTATICEDCVAYR